MYASRMRKPTMSLAKCPGKNKSEKIVNGIRASKKGFKINLRLMWRLFITNKKIKSAIMVGADPINNVEFEPRATAKVTPANNGPE